MHRNLGPPRPSRIAARAAIAATLLLFAWGQHAHAQRASSLWAESRWWLAGGIGGMVVPPVHAHAITVAGEVGAARGPLELVFHKSTGRAWGGSQRSGTALLLGASGAAKFVAGHVSLGAGRVSGCNQDGEASPCDRVPDISGLAFRIGVDLFAAGALGLQFRYQGIGGGSQAYRPFTAGIVLGRLVPHPPWDRP